MQIIVRGNEVLFTSTPVDEDGNPVTPGGISLNVDYVTTTGRGSTVLSMAQSGASWTTTWDSSGAQAGIVYWSVRSSLPSAADEGSFELDANPANPDA